MLKRTKVVLARRFRNSQRGQTVVILAFGLIALIAFVGLVTDISIMFVRFSTLRRAVDSAALAAAGQVREGTDYATVALSARQYIALHGLKPHTVWVETCETDIAAWRKEPGNAAKPLDQMPKTDLCDWDNPKKLVRVKAQIESETTFLKIIGIQNFLLTSAAISETAVLDVALVLDNSHSMGYPTDDISWYTLYAGLDSGEVRSTCTGRLGWGGCCNDPGTNALVTLIGTEWTIYTDNNGNKKYDAGDVLGVTNNTADNDMSDLVCHPFKQVKDAARNFISGLDFTRGDRVGIVTFNRVATVLYPNNNSDKTSPTYAPPMMNDEKTAIETLNKYVGIDVNTIRETRGCLAHAISYDNLTYYTSETGTGGPDNEIPAGALRPWSYESIANCTNTNMGDGIRRANEVLTNVETIRREAVWVAIILADGAANAAYVRPEVEMLLPRDIGHNVNVVPNPGAPVSFDGAGYTYMNLGFCPWSTFCKYRGPSHPYTTGANPFGVNLNPDVGEVAYLLDYDNDGDLENFEEFNDPIELGDTLPASEIFPANYPECVASVTFAPDNVNPAEPLYGLFCNDMNPSSRHFCLEWKNGPNNGTPATITDPASSCFQSYDADDYARDMADWAGLAELTPTVPGNFIAMFAIGFGDEIKNSGSPSYPVGAPLLRYIADAGDNGQIDNTHERAMRGLPSVGGDVCESPAIKADPTKWCGQYYYANDLVSLNQVFEDIASRLFTRLSR